MYIRTFLKDVEFNEQLLYGNFDDKLLEYLRHLFNNTCIDNCYIVNILNIESYSPPTPSYHDGGAIKYLLRIEFKAETIIYVSGDYVYCQIIKKDDYYIVCNYDNILLCNIVENTSIKGLSVGDKIPIVLNNISYYYKHIIAGGNLLTNVPLFNTVYKIIPDNKDIPSFMKKNKTTTDHSNIVKLNDTYLYDILYKLSKAVFRDLKFTQSKFDNIKVDDIVVFNDIDSNNKITVNILKSDIKNNINILQLLITTEDLLNNIIYQYNNLVNFLNSFKLEKKITLLYDNMGF